MKIAIHNSPLGFHKRWIQHCTKKGIDYKLVDCYANDIMQQVSECDALMWHFWQSNPKDILTSQRILFSLEHAGVTVFPNFKTAWHFDDKIAQKYLLEALDLPLVNSYFFVDRKEALRWAETTTYPKVFKLKGGAGSANVRLAKSKKEAFILINKAFSSGFKQYDALSNLKERWRKYRLGNESFSSVLKGVVRIGYEPKYSKLLGAERYHVYFQDFIPNNDSDMRVIVVDEKAIAIKRMVRENDFRASGSGNILFEKELFDDHLIRVSFQSAEKLDMQCCAFDFVLLNGEPKIVEISYGYAIDAYDFCVGYWDKDLVFHEGSYDSTEWMIETVVKEINSKNA